ncbi:hypothetical protein BVX94_01615 [bacterium B17]|nr:hypothetical protein BVX94_01615 [bacterium B17]
MRKYIVLTMAVLAAANVFAAPLSQGTKEVSIEGSYDPSTANGKSINAEASFGYFSADNIEIGVSAGFSENDLIEGWSAGVFAEYHIANSSIFTPFVGVSAKYYNTEVTESVIVDVSDTADEEVTEVEETEDTTDTVTEIEDTTTVEDNETVEETTDETESTEEATETTTKTETDAVVLEARAGVKCFIARNISVSAAYVWAFANEDIYFDGDDVESTDQRIEVGMRFYF